VKPEGNVVDTGRTCHKLKVIRYKLIAGGLSRLVSEFYPGATHTEAKTNIDQRRGIDRLYRETKGGGRAHKKMWPKKRQNDELGNFYQPTSPPRGKSTFSLANLLIDCRSRLPFGLGRGMPSAADCLY
jgi:hypothetical protein